MNAQHAEGDDAARKTVEVRARTVDEAVARGLVRLGGLSRSEVKINVVSEGKGGLLGFGAEEAVVELTPLRPGESPEDVVLEPRSAPEPEPTPTPEPAPEPEPTPEPLRDAPAEPWRAPEPEPEPEPTPEVQAAPEPPVSTPPRGEERAVPAPTPAFTGDAEAVAREITLNMLSLLGCEDVTIERSDTLLPVEIEDEQSLVFGIQGRGAEKLLENDAEPLLALQFLARLATSRATDQWLNLLLDVNGDRTRRVKELFFLAEQSAELVERDGRAVSLPPMTPYERRVIHLALRDHETVATQSIGSGDGRKVTVRLKGQMLPNV